MSNAAVNGLDDFVRLDEKFQFHLLELARAEGEIARRDFVAERLADLRDAERDVLPRRFQNIFELRENRLRGFRAEISDVVFALNRPDVSFEHQIERTRLRSIRRHFRDENRVEFSTFRSIHQ